jgi:hypothetical protein
MILLEATSDQTRVLRARTLPPLPTPASNQPGFGRQIESAKLSSRLLPSSFQLSVKIQGSTRGLDTLERMISSLIKSSTILSAPELLHNRRRGCRYVLQSLATVTMPSIYHTQPWDRIKLAESTPDHIKLKNVSHVDGYLDAVGRYHASRVWKRAPDASLSAIGTSVCYLNVSLDHQWQLPLTCRLSPSHQVHRLTKLCILYLF